MAETRIKDFEDLRVWQSAHALVLAVYCLTKTFPKEEMFGLTSQMRLAAFSVPANIAEGFGRSGKKEKANFYNIALGSLSELRYYFILSKSLEYVSEISDLQEACITTSKMLQNLMESVRGSIP
jgi:four helix bundle protein